MVPSLGIGIRRRATTDHKPMNGPSGLRTLIWMLIVSVVVLLGIATVGWIIDFFHGAL
jgi:hypothetical protein